MPIYGYSQVLERLLLLSWVTLCFARFLQSYFLDCVTGQVWLIHCIRFDWGSAGLDFDAPLGGRLDY